MSPTTYYVDATELACSRCGVLEIGQHRTPIDCIDALRSVIADLEMRSDTHAIAPAGGRRERKDHRYVILDGHRLCLADAARLLGMSAAALHG